MSCSQVKLHFMLFYDATQLLLGLCINYWRHYCFPGVCRLRNHFRLPTIPINKKSPCLEHLVSLKEPDPSDKRPSFEFKNTTETHWWRHQRIRGSAYNEILGYTHTHPSGVGQKINYQNSKGGEMALRRRAAESGCSLAIPCGFCHESCEQLL